MSDHPPTRFSASSGTEFIEIDFAVVKLLCSLAQLSCRYQSERIVEEPALEWRSCQDQVAHEPCTLLISRRDWKNLLLVPPKSIHRVGMSVDLGREAIRPLQRGRRPHS